MRFHLRAIAQDGRLESISLQAPDEASARRQAESRGYTVLRLRSRLTRLPLPAARKERFPVVLFTQQLGTLLDAGVPLVEAIETLGEKERTPQARQVLARIAAGLRQGQPLSAALEALGGEFPALYVATIRSAERTSDLQPALGRYVAYHLQMEALRRRVINASIYPALLLAAGILVSLFLLVYVVPRFSAVYEDRATQLPLFSRLLLSWGELMHGHGALLLTVAAMGVLAAWHLLRRPAARAAVQDALWRLPDVGERMKTYQLARFYRTIGMLLGGGMPLVTALELGAQLLHPALRERLERATRAIREGRPVSESMDANGLATPVALRMLAVGERGGNMGAMLERVAAFHDDEMARWVERTTRLVEPLLMAGIGLVIGAIVILMYLPIFELAGSLG